MSRQSKKHVHKYHKVNIGYTDVWACALPDCTHHMPKHLEDMVIGKMSICWDCGESFILNPANMKDNKPICESCRTGIKDDEVELPLSAAMQERLNKL